jgi:hypothetical protein
MFKQSLDQSSFQWTLGRKIHQKMTTNEPILSYLEGLVPKSRFSHDLYNRKSADASVAKRGLFNRIVGK